MAKKTGVVCFYLATNDYAALARIANFKRVSVGEWSKQRILSALRKHKARIGHLDRKE